MLPFGVGRGRVEIVKFKFIVRTTLGDVLWRINSSTHIFETG